MVPAQAAIVRFSCTFFIGLSASFLGIALVTGFLGIPPEGLAPLVGLILIALCAGAVQAGRSLVQATGFQTGNMPLWRVALQGSTVILAGLAALAAQALSAGWLPDLPPPDDPAGWRQLGIAALLFLPLATLMARVALAIGVRLALRHRPRRSTRLSSDPTSPASRSLLGG